MLINYLKISLRVLRKHKFFSFLNISSLSLGLFPCIMLLLLLQYEYSFDTFHDQSENIYRIVLDGHYKSGPFKSINTSPKLCSNFPLAASHILAVWARSSCDAVTIN